MNGNFRIQHPAVRYHDAACTRVQSKMKTLTGLMSQKQTKVQKCIFCSALLYTTTVLHYPCRELFEASKWILNGLR